MNMLTLVVGAGGAGYQSSYGMAEEVVSLVEKAFSQ